MRRSIPVGTDDERLITLATAGNRDAFGSLYERYAVRVYRHAFFLTGDQTTAEALTAQTFLNALQAIARYEDRGVPFVAWLFRIVGNLALNHRKSAKNGHSPLPDTVPDTHAS